jgi:hypothetical protein
MNWDRHVYKPGPIPEPHQEVFAQLNMERLVPHAGKLTVAWQVQKPFRLLDLLVFGANVATWLHSVRIATLEQVVRPFPVLQVLHSPNYSMDDLLSWLEREPDRDRLEHAKLKQQIHLTNEHPNIHMPTAAPGQQLQLTLSGPVEHVAVLGLSID